MNNSLVALNQVDGIFFIPAYQRGYRWTREQIDNLLDDFLDFIDADKKGIFFLQSIVVSDRAKIDGRPAYELIDGQQRLTTLYLIDAVLRQKLQQQVNELHFELVYESRPESGEFIRQLAQSGEVEEHGLDVDFYHMSQARRIISQWVDEKIPHRSKKFQSELEERVTFLWHDTSEETDTTPEQRFTRLNSGKIPLTDAELCRSLLLMPEHHNVRGDLPPGLFEVVDDPAFIRPLEKNALEKRQILLANDWDGMERTLREEEFWTFLKPGSEPATHMNYLLELLYLYQNNELPVPGKYSCFNTLFERLKMEKGNEDARAIWAELRNALERLKFWYNDNDYYHKIGYLNAVNGPKNLAELLQFANSHTEEEVKEEIKKRIRGSISPEAPVLDNVTYNSRELRKLLYLANVEYARKRSHRYARFPFSLKVNDSDIEHIDARNVEEFATKADMILWLADHQEYLSGITYGDYQKMLMEDNGGPAKTESPIKKLSVEEFAEKKEAALTKAKNLADKLGSSKVRLEDFKEEFQLWESALAELTEAPDSGEADKDSIYNLALLDPGLNRSFNNSKYAIKQKKMAAVLAAGEEYVPPMTQAIFMRHFTEGDRTMPRWTGADRAGYKKMLYQTLKEYWPDLKLSDKETRGE